ncbi:sigma-70 family RNA polymerase sigma factor [Paenibacillus sp. FSL R7-0333]|uniref:sigma-70 family RNA polymerase sigma factor n=1 Tax=Paenibacillus sp. FSL R7-0333 TaxID=1926587 RepID=UPI0026AFED97
MVNQMLQESNKGVKELKAQPQVYQPFAEQLQDCRNNLFRKAYCYVKNEHEALEIVSEATYKGYLAFGRMKTPQYFETWMTRIVINTAIDHLNRNKRVTYMEDHPQSYTGDEHAVPLEEKLDLYQALDRLLPEEKAYIILKFFEDLRFRDMADILELPENTVKTRFYKIIGKLKAHLKDGEVEGI